MATIQCPICNGKGKVKCEDYGRSYGTYNHKDVCNAGDCPACGGSGIIPCPECRGRGIVNQKECR